MIKAALILFGIAAIIYMPGSARAQDNAAISAADSEAVMRQANTLVLRQKLADAKGEAQRGDIVGAAKLYQEACALAESIGSGIPEETTEAVAGLTSTRLALARDAQARGDLRDADTQIKQILNEETKLKVAPNLNEVMAFKKHNDEMLVIYKGRLADAETTDKIPQMAADRVTASTLVQDGKVFYEMGKFNEAEIKLHQAIDIDPDNTTASYYLNLIKQDRIHRDMVNHNTDTQDRMEHVEKQWTLPKPSANLPLIGNPYSTNNLVWTGPGRQAIMAKLDHIRFDSISFDGMPLADVLKELTKQCQLRDPDRRGVNFLINNNPDLTPAPIGGPSLTLSTTSAFGTGGGAGGGGGGFGGANRYGGGAAAAAAPNIDPNTGLPVAPTTENQGAEQTDIGQYIIHIPSLTDVRLADLLDAIVLVSEHPIKFSIRDFAIVFSPKSAEAAVLVTRTFRVDPNTFLSGLENVSSYPLGINSSSSSGGGGGGGGGGGNNQFSTPVGVVNAFSGAGSSRSSGTSGGGGGGGGGGGSQGGSGSLLSPSQGGGGGIGGGGGGAQNAGGLAFITSQTPGYVPSQWAARFFEALGVSFLYPPGKAIFFNDRLGFLFVKATESDLDTIEQALQVLNQVPPQVHIKARFIQVQQSDENQLGFDWYLGQFNLGNQAVAQGGNPGSLTVPTSAANSIGAFPVTSGGSTIANGGQNVFSSGITPTTGSTTATITGILTNPNFQVVLHALETRTGVETLGEPEITTLSGRQTQMRATTVQTIVVGVSFQQGQSATTSTGLGATP